MSLGSLFPSPKQTSVGDEPQWFGDVKQDIYQPRASHVYIPGVQGTSRTSAFHRGPLMRTSGLQAAQKWGAFMGGPQMGTPKWMVYSCLL